MCAALFTLQSVFSVVHKPVVKKFSDFSTRSFYFAVVPLFNYFYVESFILTLKIVYYSRNKTMITAFVHIK